MLAVSSVIDTYFPELVLYSILYPEILGALLGSSHERSMEVSEIGTALRPVGLLELLDEELDEELDGDIF